MTATKDSPNLKITLPSDREVEMTRTVDFPRELVFEAWTDPKHLPKWMLGPAGWTMPVCERDNRPGGTYRTVWRKADGAEMEIKGLCREYEPPTRMVTIESWGAGWPETVNILTLEEISGRTLVSLNILYPSKEARDAALETGMKDGMNEGFIRLENYLSSIDK